MVTTSGDRCRYAGTVDGARGHATPPAASPGLDSRAGLVVGTEVVGLIWGGKGGKCTRPFGTAPSGAPPSAAPPPLGTFRAPSAVRLPRLDKRCRMGEGRTAGVATGEGLGQHVLLDDGQTPIHFCELRLCLKVREGPV